MKLIYIHQYFKTPEENGGTRSYDLARDFVLKGIKVDMLTTTSDIKYSNTGQLWNVVNIDGILVHYLYLPYSNSLSYFKRMIVFLKFLIYSSFKLLKMDADLILATSTPLTIGIPVIIKRWFQKTPFIFEVRDVWPEAVIAIGAINNKILQKCLYWLEKGIYKNASFIVPLSLDMKKSIVTRYPEYTYKTKFVIENISENSRFKVVNPDVTILEKLIGFKPRFSILYAGTFGKVNNIDYVIELAQKIYNHDRTIIFLLLGNGSEKDRLKELASELLLLNKNVFFLDPIKKNDLPLLYHEVDMGSSFVAPIETLWANSANKFFDTLAAGKPMLINHFGWQADVIREKKIGYILNPDLNNVNIKDFVKFTNNPEDILCYGMNAKILAVNNFSLEMASKKYFEIFKSIQN